MKMYQNYLSHILKKGKKTFKDYLLVQCILVGLALVSSIIAVYLMNYSGKLKAAFIIGILEFVPILGNGLYLVYQVIVNLVSQEKVIASNLAVLYLTILSVRLILEPVLLGRRLNFRVLIIVIFVFISWIVAGPSGLSIMSVIIFILNTLLNVNEIYTFEQKRKMRERKERRMRERENRKNAENHQLGE